MKPKQVVIWLVVLALAAGLYWFSLRSQEQKESAQDQANRVVALDDPLNVQSLELSGRDYPRPVTIVRQDKKHQWWMEKPVSGLADSLAVGRLIGEVLDARVKKRLTGKPDLAQFGLKPPRIKIVLTDRKGKKSTLLAGDISPTGEYLYATRPGSDQVWFLEAKIRGSLARPLLDLRDKAALDFVVADVVKLSFRVEGMDKPLTVVRRRGGEDPRWEFAGGGQASPEEVEDWLYQVHGLRVIDFVDQGIKPPEMGLEPPRGRITLYLEGGGEKGLLLGGKAKTGDERYLRRLAGGPVLVVKAESLARLKRTRRELTERRIWRMDSEDVVALEIRGGGRELAFAKELGQWRRTKPPGDEKSGTPGAMFVYDLVDLKWEKILPAGGDYGLKKPRVTIKISLADNKAQGEGKGNVKVLTLYLGKQDPKSKLVPARVEGDPRIFGLSPDFLQSIPGTKKKKQGSPQAGGK